MSTRVSEGLVLPIRDGSGHLLDDAPYRVMGTIFYPEDPAAREAFVGAFSPQSVAEIARIDGSFEGELDARAIARVGASFERVMEAAARDGRGAESAGEQLLTVLHLFLHDPRKASMRRARDIISREMTGIPASERPLKEAWAAFRSVAHLAAAWRLHQDGLRRGDGSLDPMDPATLPTFLTLAEILLVMGANHRPPIGRVGSKVSSKTTTLDAQTAWRCPPDLVLPQITVGVPKLTEYVATRIAHYRRRSGKPPAKVG